MGIGKTRIFRFRLQENLFTGIKKQANNECRTISEIIRQLLVGYLKKQNEPKLKVIEEKLNRNNK